MLSFQHFRSHPLSRLFSVLSIGLIISGCQELADKTCTVAIRDQKYLGEGNTNENTHTIKTTTLEDMKAVVANAPKADDEAWAKEKADYDSARISSKASVNKAMVDLKEAKVAEPPQVDPQVKARQDGLAENRNVFLNTSSKDLESYFSIEENFPNFNPEAIKACFAEARAKKTDLALSAVLVELNACLMKADKSDTDYNDILASEKTSPQKSVPDLTSEDTPIGKFIHNVAQTGDKGGALLAQVQEDNELRSQIATSQHQSQDQSLDQQNKALVKQNTDALKDLTTMPTVPQQPARQVVDQPTCDYKGFGEIINDAGVLAPVVGVSSLFDRVFDPIPDAYQKSSLYKWIEQALFELAVDASPVLKKGGIVFTGTELARDFAHFPELKEQFQGLKSASLKNEGSVTKPLIKLSLVKKSGLTLGMYVDRNWDRACKLLEKSFDADGKTYLQTITAKGKKGPSLNHPFNGGSCDEKKMKNYVFYNFSAKAQSETEMPDGVLLVGRNTMTGAHFFPSYDPRNRLESELSAQLRVFFSPKH